MKSINYQLNTNYMLKIKLKSKQKIKKKSSEIAFSLLLIIMFSGFTTISLQAQEKISGVVKDDTGMPLPGVSILQIGTVRRALTDINGNYSIQLVPGQKILEFSYIGFKTVQIPVNGQSTINVTLKDDIASLDEVVVVGYGTQKKESVVGAITQISGDDLRERGAGLSNVTEALQGNLPGVTTIQGSGVPGRNDMQIFIRGQGSWNGSGQPLILVDGVQRPIDNIDFNDIEKLSVLKDASATAVFGVQGANGVILITTKRGRKGKARLSLTANSTIKTVSKLPEKLNAYDAILEANSSILRQLSQDETVWESFRPIAIADKYRNPATEEERFIYPNVNWRDVLLKDMAQDQNYNLSVRGGGDNAKYFGSLGYQSVSDIFDGQRYDNGKGYEGSFKYDRFNYRTNLDFNISKTTEFSVSLGGFLGTQQSPGDLNLITNSIYELAPNIYTPIFPDGAFGRDFDDVFANSNPIVILTNTGYSTNTTFQINTDFILKQNLNFVTKGLSFQGRFSFDNTSESRQKVNDPGNNGQENVTYRVYDQFFNEVIESPDGVNDFSFVPTPWHLTPFEIDNRSIARNLLYDFSLNYNNTFAKKHNVTGLFLARRQQRARGSQFPVYREDWVGRVTYDYDKRYFLDISGAYNGSEKFGPGYRFDLFPAVAAGWTISNESFMKKVNWVDKLKIRGSYGRIGDDEGGQRFEYLKTWNSGGGAFNQSGSGNARDRSPYVFFREDNVGNPNLRWETAVKYNIGTEIGLFKNMITAEFDFYGENRSDILIPGTQRAVPDWFGTTPPSFNAGKTEVRGFEIAFGANHSFDNGINIFGNINYNHVKDVVLYREDPELSPFYQKAQGYAIGQPRSAIPGEIISSWDDIYSSTPIVQTQENQRIGYYNLYDYDGDGVYNPAFDDVPFGYPVRPQTNWSSTIGAKYKSWNLSVQFYGTQNANRTYTSRTFSNGTDVFFKHELGYWTKDNQSSTTTQPVFKNIQAANDPRNSFYDASLVRLRSIAIGYNLPKTMCEKLGVSSLRLYANGNNLFLWTDLPDDREFNSSATKDSSFRGDYPTLIRYNFGLSLEF